MKLLLDLQGMQTESRYRGIGRQAGALAETIAARPRNHDIHILLNQRLVEGLEDILETFTPLIGRRNVHLFNTPGSVAEREPGNLWRTNAAELVREAKIAAIAPDVVHIASLFEGFVDDAVTSIGRFDAPHATAVTLHDLIPLTDPTRYLAQANARMHWLRRAQFLKRADLLLSVSEYSALEAAQRLHILPHRIAVISAGVDPIFRPAPSDADDPITLLRRYNLDKPFILYVGAIDPRKNVEMIFTAFAALPADLRESRLLVFVGRLFDEEIGRLKIAGARNGIPSTQIRCLQHVSDGDLIQLYGQCDAFVFPSMHEGFGLPALEAMACGAPTLAAAATSLVEVVGDERLLFDPRDSSSLVAKLAPLLSNPEHRENARQIGLARAAQFTWQKTADLALDALEILHDSRQSAQISRGAPLARKPLLAFVSPLPADRSGVADYSAELLPELGRFFEIECILPEGNELSNQWIETNFVVRSIDFFERNAGHYDHILYSFGNSHFHAHMIELIRRFPGVALMHDFFMSDLIDWMANTGIVPEEDFFRALYKSHGLSGLLVERRDGRRVAIEHFPCNQGIFEAATGVIVHSGYAIEQARTLYGDGVANALTLIPHLRAVDPTGNRDAARARLGLGEGELLICSFGILTERKCSRDLLDGWLQSESSRRPGTRLVFVGENLAGDYGDEIAARIAGDERITITGFASESDYRDYLAAADIAVQLRTQSRGETSGTILDCLATGTPVIVNTHATSAELPDDVVHKISDHFATSELAAAIDLLAKDSLLRTALATRARAHLVEHHHPERVGEAFRDAIAKYEQYGQAAIERPLIQALADFVSPIYPDRDDHYRLATTIATTWPRTVAMQILYDVTVLAESDARTGIQRVVRSILINLIENPPPGFRIEPVIMDNHRFRYARQWTAKALDLPSWVFPDDPVEFQAGDIYLAIDWVPDRLPDTEGWLADFGRAGGRVVIGVHDLLPFHFPEHFPDFMPTVMRHWFETALRTADQFVCVSRTVADDVVKFGSALMDGRKRRIAVDFFHNAADLSSSAPTRGRPSNADDIVAHLKARPSFLMVGTIEPRKGHTQVLRGFERLWRQQQDVNLVIVGKKGWMMGELINALERHRESDTRLFWLSDISDEFLEELYAACSALVAASAGEGFGLPLIEAARHGLPLIVRDIAVFREVAGENAFYFSGDTPQAISDALLKWLELEAQAKAPGTENLHFQTWRESTKQLVKNLLATNHYAEFGNCPALPTSES